MDRSLENPPRRFSSQREREIQERLDVRAKEIGAAATLAENKIVPDTGDLAYTLAEDEILYVQSAANAAWWRTQEMGGGKFAMETRKQVFAKDKNVAALRSAWEDSGRPVWHPCDVIEHVPKLASYSPRTLQRYLRALKEL